MLLRHWGYLGNTPTGLVLAPPPRDFDEVALGATDTAVFNACTYCWTPPEDMRLGTTLMEKQSSDESYRKPQNLLEMLLIQMGVLYERHIYIYD